MTPASPQPQQPSSAASPSTQAAAPFARLVEIMATLRAPNGCPWDRKQTHESLKAHLLEETYEVLETIDRGDTAKLREELGDVLLQVIFHAQIAAEAGTFTIDDVVTTLSEKLVRRHPHVFQAEAQNGDAALSPDQVYQNWEQIKKAERQAAGTPDSVLAGVPLTLPALSRAYQLQARAARVGFDWPDSREGLDLVLGKIEEECRELRQAIDNGASESARASELGDILFSVVNLARKLKTNPEDSLRVAATRFADRFRYIEAEAQKRGQSVEQLGLEEMDRLWDAAKRHLAAQPNEATR
ncbi:MAG: nucleoside triphosphate pyrophosphohydrolase [Nitrospiraceae bacterium]